MIHNFGEVVPGQLWRSGRYTASALCHMVQQCGIRQVIDLRDRESALLAARTYRRMGISFVRYPLDETKGLPDAALEVWDGVTPTLIHCWKGAHRTGAWVARLRLERMGWTATAVHDELMGYGFGRIADHHELYKSIWRGYESHFPMQHG